jgi:hypothetical protein
MPTLSASDYTTFLKFKAGAASSIKPNIQTRDNVSVSQSVINANVLASQAAFVATPTVTAVRNNASVLPVQPMRTVNTKALSTVTGSGALSSSFVNRPGGIPLASKTSQGTYYIPPQGAGWKNAGPPGH